MHSQHRGVEQLVARRAHNPEVGGPSPPSATKQEVNPNGWPLIVFPPHVSFHHIQQPITHLFKHRNSETNIQIQLALQPLRAQKARFCARNAQNPGKIAHSDTKTSILCSKRPKLGVPKAKSAQKSRFCAREERKLASGSITAETLTVNVAFLQITAHTSKMQMLHNQIIDF